MVFEALLFFVSLAAGGVASVVGFGIGSLITPLLSVSVGTKLAVAMVSIPHLIGTSVRFWMLRGHVDQRVLWSFGAMSALGGLLGALLHASVNSSSLTIVFGGILVFSGFMGASGFSGKLRFDGLAAWFAGGASGLFGGMVGNQGGIRSAALLGFRLSKESFVATATAIGLIVDCFRMPVYFWNEWRAMAEHSALIALSSIGVVIGTYAGARLLKRMPKHFFKRVVSALILFLGVFMLCRGLSERGF